MLKKIIFASHNQGKIREIKEILAPFGVEVVSDLSLPDVEETGTTFAENAILKAETISQATGLPCLADDSGLCVNALNGRPGVYSARYAPNRDFNKGMELMLEEMQDKKDRSAYFICVLALAIPNKETKTFEGIVNGNIALKQEGNGGFGYDPIFIPEGFEHSFGTFSPAEKAKISHRARALEKFVKELKNETL